MDKAALLHLAECCRQADGAVQEACQIDRLSLVPPKNPIQRLTARVLKNEDCPPFVTSEPPEAWLPRGIEFGCSEYSCSSRRKL
jgi:hypothetical protein